MRNPIFAAESIILDQYPTGDIHHRTGERSVKLSCGGQIVRLGEDQPLVEIGTESGLCLIISPETAFSLANEGGRLIRYNPIAPAPPAIDWQDDLDDVELRRWALAGMVCASGVHIFNRFRTSYFVCPCPDLAANTTQFLRRLGDRMEMDGVIHKKSNQVTMKDIEGGTFIRSRILTSLIGTLLKPLTQEVTFNPLYISRLQAHAFLHGLLSTASKVDDTIVVRHRSSATIRTLAERLTFDFGVPCDIHIHPMEPALQVDVTRPEGHRFRLSAEQVDCAVAAGLIEGKERHVKVYSHDRIVSHTPLPRKVPSVIVLPGEKRKFPLTVNSFVFNAGFEIPVGITEIATHPAVLDSSDPTRF